MNKAFKIVKNQKFNINKLQVKEFFKVELNTTTKNNFTKSPINRNKQRFYKIQNKNIWEKLKSIFKTKASVHEEIIIKNTSRQSNEEWYEPKEPLIFINKKYNLLKIADGSRRSVTITENLVMLPLALFSGYKLGKSLILLRPIRSIFWGILFTVFFRSYRGISQNKNLLIFAINLLENGKQCEIIINKETKIVDIQGIRQLNQEEAQYYYTMAGSAYNAFIPVIVNTNFYLMSKESIIPDRELLNVIMSGKYIKMKDDIVVDREDVIDIK